MPYLSLLCRTRLFQGKCSTLLINTVRLNTMWRDNDSRIRAAEGPLNFRIALAGTVSVIGFVLLFLDLRLGIPMFGGGILGLIANLWARENRESPWVHGMDNSEPYECRDPRMDQAFDYKRLLDSGLISEYDYQIAMKSLFPHLPTPNTGEQDAPSNSGQRSSFNSGFPPRPG